MIRSRVDLPQPEGPTMVINSPMFGASSMTKEMSWMATFGACAGPNFLVTFLNATTSGTRAGAGAEVPAGRVSLRAAAAWLGVAGLWPPGVPSLEVGSAIGLFVLTIGEKQIAANPPELIAGDGDQNNHNNNGVYGLGMAASFGNTNQPAQSILRQQNNFSHDNPAPAHSVYASEMVPDVGLGDRKENVPHQLPLRGAFGHRHVQKSRRHIGDILDHQGQQSHEAPDEEEPDFLGFAGAKPGHAQRDENHDRHVRPGQRKWAEKCRYRRESGHVHAQRHGDQRGQAETGGDPQPGINRAADQALLGVQGHERF